MIEEWIPWNYDMTFEKDKEHVSQGYTISDRCPRNNTHKVRKLVK